MESTIIKEGLSEELAQRYKRILEEEAEELRHEALSTGRLAVEVYESGERKLGLLVIREAIRIAKGYLELDEKTGKDPSEAYELIAGFEVIQELMKDGEKPVYIRSVLDEL